jgi:hypothetical protein
MITSFGRLGAIAVVATTAFAPSHHDAAGPRRRAAAAASPCAADSSYQRLAFWVGDWGVHDSAGTRYATHCSARRVGVSRARV